MHGDNLSIVNNKQSSRGTKHIDVRYHFVRHKVKSKEVSFRYKCPSGHAYYGEFQDICCSTCFLVFLQVQKGH